MELEDYKDDIIKQSHDTHIVSPQQATVSNPERTSVIAQTIFCARPPNIRVAVVCWRMPQVTRYMA